MNTYTQFDLDADKVEALAKFATAIIEAEVSLIAFQKRKAHIAAIIVLYKLLDREPAVDEIDRVLSLRIFGP